MSEWLFKQLMDFRARDTDLHERYEAGQLDFRGVVQGLESSVEQALRDIMAGIGELGDNREPEIAQ